ncbi:hypothetical protein HFD88_004775 [Aspergillus terreus]|nr:hypothetical protein HFD88_004775 [Aspergillus terreus]
MTSSFASVIDLNRPADPNFVYTGEHWSPLTYAEAVDPSSTAVTAYRGSKKFAELEAWSFMEREKPDFDLAEAHVKALFTPAAGGKRYVAAPSEPFSYELGADIIRAEFEWAAQTVTKNYEVGKKVAQGYRLDGEAVTRELGVQFRGFRETVVDFVRQVKGRVPI